VFGARFSPSYAAWVTSKVKTSSSNAIPPMGRYASLAREIVASSPDLIVTGTNPVVIAFG
jgi:hypothetical protein